MKQSICQKQDRSKNKVAKPMERKGQQSLRKVNHESKMEIILLITSDLFIRKLVLGVCSWLKSLMVLYFIYSWTNKNPYSRTITRSCRMPANVIFWHEMCILKLQSLLLLFCKFLFYSTLLADCNANIIIVSPSIWSNNTVLTYSVIKYVCVEVFVMHSLITN